MIISQISSYRFGNKQKFSASSSGADFHVYYTINEISKTLDIKVYCEALKDVEEKRRESMVAFMLELFIGELEF